MEEQKEGGEGTPRDCPERPPPTAAETAPTADEETSLPTLGGPKLSLLGSCDASRSPTAAAFFSASRKGGVDAVSPCESARYFTSNKGEQDFLSLSSPPEPGPGTPGLTDEGHQASSSPSSSPCLSPDIDKLLQLPRGGRPVRFFIDGDEGLLGSEKRNNGC